jgi:glycosyltransferase involved in cell wall biosynthesis
MRIAVFHDLPSGGAKRATFEILKQLYKNHHIDVFSLSSAEHEFCDLRPLAKAHTVYPYQPSPLFGQPFGRINQLQRYRDLARLEAVAKKIAGDIDKRGYDFCWVQPSMWTQAPQVLHHLHTPTIYHLHEPPRHLYDPVIPRPYHQKRRVSEWVNSIDPLIKLYRAEVTRVDSINTKSADFILANSKFSASNIKEIYSREADVRYLGVDVDLFKPIEGMKKGNFVLSVGAIQPSKGFDFLIEALALIPVTMRPALKVIGNSSNQYEIAYLKKLAWQLEVELDLRTLVTEQELVDSYNQALLFVYAPVREPFGLTPVEAMSCGTAVVGIDEGGVRESVVHGETGLTAPREAKKFAEAVESLLGDPKKTAFFEENGRQQAVQCWDSKKLTALVEDYFFQCLGVTRSQTSQDH